MSDKQTCMAQGGAPRRVIPILVAKPSDAVAEGQQVMSICNACRYCEGFCAVFPAMTRRLAFTEGDMHYLANLCHNCGECYHACQYAPPHEFAVNVPQTMAKIRGETYRDHAVPRVLASAYANNGLTLSLVLAACLALFMLGAEHLLGARLMAPVAGGNFYALLPHRVLAGLFGAVFSFVAVALLAGFGRYWRGVGEDLAELAKPFALRRALKDVLKLEYLHGGGQGCTYPNEERSMWRRWFHHFTFYGFLLCFAATALATVYHYALGWEAPYGYLTLPVALGALGGLGLVVGPVGLYVLKRRRLAALADTAQDGMDVAFIALLVLTSATGLALLAVRETAAMGVLLVVHLSVVMTLFLTMPYGKFVHGLYRAGALVKYALERKRPQPNAGVDA